MHEHSPSYEREASVLMTEFREAYDTGMVVIEARPSVGPVYDEGGLLVCITGREELEKLFSELINLEIKKRGTILDSVIRAISRKIRNTSGITLQNNDDFLEDIAILMAARIAFGEGVLKRCDTLSELHLVVDPDTRRDWSRRGKLSPEMEALFSASDGNILLPTPSSQALH